jgi:hypothetical protein
MTVRPANLDDAAELDRLRARAARGLELTPRQAWQLSTRLMLQAPPDLTPRQIKHVADDLDRRIRGLPPGAFMALDALRLLADGGNELAAAMFSDECRKLGLTTPLRSFPR